MEPSKVKLSIEFKAVQSFLDKKFPGNQDLQALTGGETAQAYLFSLGEEKRVLKLTTNEVDLQTEKLAFESFVGINIPIPKLFETGIFDDRKFYSIADLAPGTRFDLLSSTEQDQSYPFLLKTLGHIHSIVGECSNTFGYINPNRGPQKDSWKAFMGGFLPKLPSTPDDAPTQNFITTCYDDYTKLVEQLPELNRLVHGDFGFDNAFMLGQKTSAVIDWAHACYGDPIYDVAWLTFFSGPPSTKILEEYIRSAKPSFSLENLDSRMRCYQIAIALRSMDFYINSNQPESFQFALKQLEMICSFDLHSTDIARKSTDD